MKKKIALVFQLLKRRFYQQRLLLSALNIVYFLYLVERQESLIKRKLQKGKVHWQLRVVGLLKVLLMTAIYMLAFHATLELF